MKKPFRILSLIMALVLMVSTLASCDIFGGSGTTEAPDTECTVYWYQGQKLLKEEKVENGALVSSWTPKVAGKDFVGWFSNPGCTTAFDFTQPIVADTEIYASFKTTGVVEPVEPVYADYYLIGTGTGSLSVSAWNHENSATKLGMTALGNDVYTITIDMYTGDMFQICHGLSWDGQMGIGYLEGAALVADSETQAEVKDTNGDVVFTGAQEYSNPMTAWNITLAAGQDGQYKFTLDTANGSITWELIKRLEHKDPVPVVDAVYFVGTFNGWATIDIEEKYKLTVSDDGKTWTGTLEITSDMYEDWTVQEGHTDVPHAAVKLYNAGTSTWIASAATGDNLYLLEGKYHFSFTSGTTTFEYWPDGEDGPVTPTPPEKPEVPEEFAGKVYFVPSEAWSANSSLYGAWCWEAGKDGKWVEVTDAGNGSFECVVPEGCTHIIFVDFVGGTTTMDWNSKETQTADLPLPEKGSADIYFHISTNSWTSSAK